MSEFDDMMRAGFGEVVAMLGGAVISTGAGQTLVAKSCVLDNVTLTREQRDSGYKLDYDSVAELARDDATALGLYPMESDDHRPSCMVGGRPYKRMNVEDDPHDPMVRLHLKAQKKTQ